MRQKKTNLLNYRIEEESKSVDMLRIFCHSLLNISSIETENCKTTSSFFIGLHEGKTCRKRAAS